MKTGRPPKAPIYVLPHGIEVVGEYKPRGANRYWRLRIRPHPFFEGIALRNGGHYVRRSRVILASKLGRPLTQKEHAHHDDEDRGNDSESNIKALSSSDHNKHHKVGSQHKDESKEKTGATLKRLYAEGVMQGRPIKNRDQFGRISK